MGRPPSAAGNVATIVAAHWHLLSDGFEFEDADGRFVHILMSDDHQRRFARHITDTKGKQEP